MPRHRMCMLSGRSGGEPGERHMGRLVCIFSLSIITGCLFFSIYVRLRRVNSSKAAFGRMKRIYSSSSSCINSNMATGSAFAWRFGRYGASPPPPFLLCLPHSDLEL